MGKRGPQPKPTLKLKRQGTLRPCRRPKKEAEPDQGEPTMPKGLTPRAKKFWPELIDDLRKCGTLFGSDARVIADVCEALDEFYTIKGLLNKSGYTGKGVGGADARNPLLGSLKESRDAIRQGLDRLGLSPSARTRIELHPKGDGRPKDDVDRMFA